jgi:hypothetical protein
VRPFIETLRVTNPVRQSRDSPGAPGEASFAWGRGDRHCEAQIARSNDARLSPGTNIVVSPPHSGSPMRMKAAQ